MNVIMEIHITQSSVPLSTSGTGSRSRFQRSTRTMFTNDLHLTKFMEFTDIVTWQSVDEVVRQCHVVEYSGNINWNQRRDTIAHFHLVCVHPAPRFSTCGKVMYLLEFKINIVQLKLNQGSRICSTFSKTYVNCVLVHIEHGRSVCDHFPVAGSPYGAMADIWDCYIDKN